MSGQDSWDTLFGILPQDLPLGVRYFVVAMIVRGTSGCAHACMKLLCDTPLARSGSGCRCFTFWP